jgi:hypothetical protein
MDHLAVSKKNVESAVKTSGRARFPKFINRAIFANADFSHAARELRTEKISINL